ncbi:MAG: cell wall synthase accessory phosphoprotein MacP [Lactococcus sp.]|uniref:cell wall synthase accessory phosphoprotein MacP n=1 Tax=Lactococcus sp. TaxID=44273 RepID=UPI0035AEE9B5
MPRPILTDEIIEEARRNRKHLERHLQEEMEQDEELSEKYSKIEKDLSKKSVYKSRRIENAKQVERSKSVNKWLIIVALFALALFVGFVWYYFF